MQILSLDIIGTHLQITIDTPHSCDEVFSDIRMRLEDFEQKYSRFIEGNWLHVLNISRRGILDTNGKNMLSYMLEFAQNTDGYFDPTVGKRLTELGYGKNGGYSFGERRFGDYRDIEVIGDEVLLHGDILLEFGGVGKGYLIDIIKNIIEVNFRHAEARSIQISENQSMDFSVRQNDGYNQNTRFLINFGGDLYGRGGWKVGLESPFAPDEIIGTHILDGGCLACSAGTRRKWGNHHHLIDPKTGESAREVVASYVEGDSGMIADAYATTLCVMPWELARETLSKTPEISGVIVKYDGAIFRKEGSRSEIFT